MALVLFPIHHRVVFHGRVDSSTVNLVHSLLASIQGLPELVPVLLHLVVEQGLIKLLQFHHTLDSLLTCSDLSGQSNVFQLSKALSPDQIGILSVHVGDLESSCFSLLYHQLVEVVDLKGLFGLVLGISESNIVPLSLDLFVSFGLLLFHGSLLLPGPSVVGNVALYVLVDLTLATHPILSLNLSILLGFLSLRSVESLLLDPILHLLLELLCNHRFIELLQILQLLLLDDLFGGFCIVVLLVSLDDHTVPDAVLLLVHKAPLLIQELRSLFGVLDHVHSTDSRSGGFPTDAISGIQNRTSLLTDKLTL